MTTSSENALGDDLFQDAIGHMNEDHASAVLAYARGLAGLTWAESAVLTELDTQGFALVATGRDQASTVRLPFPTPVVDADDLRRVLVDLAKQARASLA